MNYAADDYDAIRKRVLKLRAPSFKSGGSAPGTHCLYCVRPADEPCPDPCSKAYENKYGVGPYEGD